LLRSVSLDIGPQKTRIAGGQFSRFMQFSFGFEDDSDKVIDNLYQMDFIGDATRDTSRALNDLFIIFKLYARSNVPKVLVVLTYGESEDIVKLELQASTLRNAGNVKILSICVNDSPEKLEVELRKISEKVFTSVDYTNGLHNTLYADLAKEICVETS